MKAADWSPAPPPQEHFNLICRNNILIIGVISGSHLRDLTSVTGAGGDDDAEAG